MNEPRPAMISARPPEIRSMCANCSKTRTGSSEESTLTALESRICSVTAAIAPAGGEGEERERDAGWQQRAGRDAEPQRRVAGRRRVCLGDRLERKRDEAAGIRERRARG